MRKLLILFIVMSLLNFITNLALSSGISDYISGTMSEKEKYEKLMNLALNGEGEIALQARKILDELAYSGEEGNKRFYDSTIQFKRPGDNLMDDSFSVSDFKSLSKLGKTWSNSIYCGYLPPTSHSGNSISKPDIAKAWIKFDLSRINSNTPIKKAYLKVRWAVGDTEHLVVYEAKDVPSSFEDFDKNMGTEYGRGNMIDITKLVQNWLKDSAQNKGLILDDDRSNWQYQNYPDTWKEHFSDHVVIPVEDMELILQYHLNPHNRPAYQSGNALGYYIWHDTAGWHIRMNGNGLGHHHVFTGRILTDGFFSSVQAKGIESGDIYTQSTRQITFTFYVDGEEDGIDFIHSGSSMNGITFDIKLDSIYDKDHIYIGEYKLKPHELPFRLY